MIAFIVFCPLFVLFHLGNPETAPAMTRKFSTFWLCVCAGWCVLHPGMGAPLITKGYDGASSWAIVAGFTVLACWLGLAAARLIASITARLLRRLFRGWARLLGISRP